MMPPANGAAPARQRSVCLLSMSAIPDDPRVRRQGDALFEKGWDVSAVGVPGARSASPNWRSYDTEHLPAIIDKRADRRSGGDVAAPGVSGSDRPPRLRSRVLAALPASMQVTVVGLTDRLLPFRHVVARQRYRAAYVTRSLLAHLQPDQAAALYWSWSSVNAVYAAASRLKADVWVANDWLMLPIAARLAEEKGGHYVYDTHEFAVDEYRERLKWRLFQRPIVKSLESRYIRGARTVSTVSEGIATGLQRIYSLPERPLVIRNTPRYSFPPGRDNGERIRVLYHGIVAPVRGLEPLVASVKDWRPAYDLTIRGPVDDTYRRTLEQLIAEHGVGDRVTLAPPVAMIDLVAEAALYDVGFFAMPNLSQQHQYVLPNKLFEYIMAGLAICVSDQPEMRQVVQTHGVGVVMESIDAAQIAATVNSLTPDRISSFKVRSREAAKVLCWECESERLIAAWSANL
jgi:glycosyltransferase involved in cell wall biosynthesis